MAALAAERDINFHVDACLGGFFLPFAERLGYPVPPFDFRVPGVTSISADLHKFGYTAKGASALLWRDRALYHYQGFSFDGWSSGVYRTPTLAGTRPGGAIAAAWAVLTYLGEEGYLRLVAGTMQFVRRLLAGIAAIPELEVHGQPDMSVFAYGARHIDIDAVADELARRGWWVYRERQPPGIHLILSAGHEPFMVGYVDDLAEATRAVVRGGLTSQGREVRYG